MQKALVFISCGQRVGEKEIGLKISKYLKRKGFDVYFSEEVQTPYALTSEIYKALRTCEYCIVINFERKNSEVGSLFIQQEFAIATYLEVPMLAFHKGKVGLEGIGKHLLLKSIPFTTYEDIRNYLKINARTWNPFSKNQLELSFNNHHSNMVIQNASPGTLSNWFHITVLNLSSQKYCKSCYGYVEEIIDLNSKTKIISSNDYKTELVWAGTQEISINLPQGGKRDLDAFWWIHGTNGLQFHFKTTSTSYGYSNLNYGKYELIYAIISDNFPTAKIKINIEFSSTGIAILDWQQTP